MLRLAEILLEPGPAESWAQLRQIGVEEAVGVLPRGAVDWRAHARGLLDVLRKLRAQRYEVVVELRGDLRDIAFAALTGA